MKDYPDKMTAEQARTFQADVLDIVSQIPHGRVTTYGMIATLAPAGHDGRVKPVKTETVLVFQFF